MNDVETVSPFLIRAAVGRALRDADAIVADAQAEAARLVTAAEGERDAIAARARADGLAQAATETATLAAAAAETLARFWDERENELRDLALAIAHRVLSRMPAHDLLVQLARDAIAEHACDTRLALRVAPELLSPFRAALATQPFGDHVTLAADPDLPPDGCALLHPRGRTDLGLLAQFRAMVNAPATRVGTP